MLSGWCAGGQAALRRQPCGATAPEYATGERKPSTVPRPLVLQLSCAALAETAAAAAGAGYIAAVDGGGARAATSAPDAAAGKTEVFAWLDDDACLFACFEAWL